MDQTKAPFYVSLVLLSFNDNSLGDINALSSNKDGGGGNGEVG